jgi:hypothetical protein
VALTIELWYAPIPRKSCFALQKLKAREKRVVAGVYRYSTLVRKATEYSSEDVVHDVIDIPGRLEVYLEPLKGGHCFK